MVGLFSFQVLLGGATAHHGGGARTSTASAVAVVLYSLLRTWHIQSALFWIASGFPPPDSFLAPIINGGKDPKLQKLGVDVLFWALVVVVLGSFVGNYLAIAQIMPAEWNFWLGHQGYGSTSTSAACGRSASSPGGLLAAAGCCAASCRLAFRQPGDKNLLALLTGLGDRHRPVLRRRLVTASAPACR